MIYSDIQLYIWGTMCIEACILRFQWLWAFITRNNYSPFTLRDCIANIPQIYACRLFRTLSGLDGYERDAAPRTWIQTHSGVDASGPHDWPQVPLFLFMEGIRSTRVLRENSSTRWLTFFCCKQAFMVITWQHAFLYWHIQYLSWYHRQLSNCMHLICFLCFMKLHQRHRC